MSETAYAEANGHPRRMLDRYEVIAEIARGGMGTVLLARLEGAGGFERLMAIKLMHEHLAADKEFVTMLLDEARTAAAIHHPNAVGIVDVAHSPVGYYLVMSYVEGFTLNQLVTHPELDARERIRLGLRVLVDACHGLHAAHTAKDAKGKPLSIVHRDVSPQNVLVGLDGVGRIVDFGIALAASRVTTSRTGVLKGKPSYMAPEQVKSEPVDARADVFALGIIAWEILTGARLFVAEVDLATLLQVIEAPIAPPSTKQPLVSPELDAVVLKALTRKVAERTPDARTLAVELERAASAAGLLAGTHEVADAIERLFAEEIRARQEAIRHHLSTSSGEKKPLLPGQLGLIPRLYDKGPVQRSAPAVGAESGVRARSSDPDAPTAAAIGPRPTAQADAGERGVAPVEGAPAEAAERAAADAPAKEVPAPAVPTPPARTVVRSFALGVGLAVLVAALGGAGLYAWSRGHREASAPVEGDEVTEAAASRPAAGPGHEGEAASANEPATVEAASAIAAETRTATPAETESAEAASAEREGEPSAPAASAQRADEPGGARAASADPSAPSATGASARGARHRESERPRGRRPEASVEPAPDPEPRRGPTLETNPYLVR